MNSTDKVETNDIKTLMYCLPVLQEILDSFAILLCFHDLKLLAV